MGPNVFDIYPWLKDDELVLIMCELYRAKKSGEFARRDRVIINLAPDDHSAKTIIFESVQKLQKKLK